MSLNCALVRDLWGFVPVAARISTGAVLKHILIRTRYCTWSLFSAYVPSLFSSTFSVFNRNHYTVLYRIASAWEVTELYKTRFLYAITYLSQV
jgi:hypothetical protein